MRAVQSIQSLMSLLSEMVWWCTTRTVESPLGSCGWDWRNRVDLENREEQREDLGDREEQKG